MEYSWERKGKRSRGEGDETRKKKKRKQRYSGAYSTSALEDLLSTRGESNAKLLALQRGKTLITKNTNDRMRAQTSTAKTFNGIDILDNLVPYDKNVVKEPDNWTLPASFGNYQAASVPDHLHLQGQVLRTYTPCPF